MARIAITLTLVTLLLTAPGCSRLVKRSKRSYRTVVSDTNRDPEKAREKCEKATVLFEKGQLTKAEQALQDALIADVSYAPAHNNLGRIYFDQGKLYLAAWEFEYARRLLPESAEVMNNLGMVYEAAGQEQRAIESFTTALSLDPGNPIYTGNLARTLLRNDDDPDQVALLLKDLLLNDTRPEWVAWARDQLNLRYDVRTAAHAQQPRDSVENGSPPEEVHPLPVPEHLDDLSQMDTPPIPLLDTGNKSKQIR